MLDQWYLLSVASDTKVRCHFTRSIIFHLLDVNWKELGGWKTIGVDNLVVQNILLRIKQEGLSVLVSNLLQMKDFRVEFYRD